MAPPGLDQDRLGVEAGFLVHLVNKVLREGPQKGTLSELENPLRGVFQQVALIALALQKGITELFHKFTLLLFWFLR